MKYFFSILFFSCLMLAGSLQAQQPRQSPAAKVSETLKSGAIVSISYSQPSLKGRAIGTTVEPTKGKVWRMGANEATVFETDKDVAINGQKLPAGKYSLFGLWADDGYTLIFNKEYQIWGTMYDQNKDKDALRVKADVKTTDKTQETLTYTLDKEGVVNLLWGNMIINFKVQ